MCLVIIFIILICGFSFDVGATEEENELLYMDNYGVCIDDYTPNCPSLTEEPQSSVNISKYDPRDSNFTTPVKDQSPHGTCGIFASTATKVVLYGDADLNGSVSSIDTTIIQMYLAEMRDLSDDQKMASDVDGNGIVDAVDVTLIQQYLSEDISKFPVED